MRTYKEALIEKATAEYNEFLESLNGLPPEEIVQHSYEIVLKSDILTCFKSDEFDLLNAKYFYVLDYPLDYCYHEWLDSDLSYMNMLMSVIDDTVEKIDVKGINEMFLSEKEVEALRERYPVGCRILLHCMGDDPRPIEPGSKGMVIRVDDAGTVHCKFDNGRRMGLIPGEDSFTRLPERNKADRDSR